VLAQAPLQGQSFFASAGDEGAYYSTDFLPILPSQEQPDSYNHNPTVAINIEAIGWSWTYLTNLCAELGYDPVTCGIFPVGSGGGVSLFIPRPFYQFVLPGMANSVPDQPLYQLTPPPPELLVSLPTGYVGRSVPDISFNPDPTPDTWPTTPRVCPALESSRTGVTLLLSTRR
jgi:kumamolisin